MPKPPVTDFPNIWGIKINPNFHKEASILNVCHHVHQKGKIYTPERKNMSIFNISYNSDKETLKPYFYWLSSLEFLGIKSYTKLQSYFSSPMDIYYADEEKLKKCGIFTSNALKILLETRKQFNPEKEYENLLKKGIHFFPREDDKFPERLLNIPNSPLSLFCLGKLPDERLPSVSIIGARQCSYYGEDVAKQLGHELGRRNIPVISGAARGIDSIGQTACLDAGGTSYAVLGSGVDILYPKESRLLFNRLPLHGGIISEYPPAAPAIARNFALRNRIISGLSDILCVVEAKQKSGTLITVDAALEQGREVYVVPGRITDMTSIGCNELIKQGAQILTSPEELAESILERFTLNPIIEKAGKVKKAKAAYNLSPLQNWILNNAGETSFTPEELTFFKDLPLNISSQDLLIECLNLSNLGFLKNLGGTRFRLLIKY